VNTRQLIVPLQPVWSDNLKASPSTSRDSQPCIFDNTSESMASPRMLCQGHCFKGWNIVDDLVALLTIVNGSCPTVSAPQQRLERLLSTSTGATSSLSALDEMYRRVLKDALANGDIFEADVVDRFKTASRQWLEPSSSFRVLCMLRCWTQLEALLGEETNALSTVVMLRSVFMAEY
jgi:hypothetical protein